MANRYGKNNPDAPWPEKDEALIAAWRWRGPNGEMHTVREIAVILGLGEHNKNMVHGRRKRLGLEKREEPTRVYNPALSRTERARLARAKARHKTQAAQAAATVASMRESTAALRVRTMTDRPPVVSAPRPETPPAEPTPWPSRPHMPMVVHDDAPLVVVNLLPIFVDRVTAYAWGAQRGICTGHLDLGAVNRKRAQHGLAPFMIEQPVGRRFGLSG